MSKRKRALIYSLIAIGIVIVAAVLGSVCGKLLIDNII